MKKKESVKNKQTKQMTIEERKKERRITKLLNVKKQHSEKKKVVNFCFEIVLGFSVCLCLVFFCFVLFLRSWSRVVAVMAEATVGRTNPTP